MHRKIFRLLTIAVFFCTFCASVSAQERPFKVGETLKYEAKFNKIVRGITVAELNFSVNAAPNGKDWLIKSEAVSKGTLIKLARYSFLQQIQSTVEGAGDFRVLESVKHDVQKERVRDSVAKFDYQKKTVSYLETDPKDATRPPRKIASDLNGQTQDIITAIYAMRLMPLAVGKSFEVTVSDTGLIYKIPVRVTAREQQKTDLGKFWCYKVEPELFGPGRYIEKDGGFIVWLTDDARRLPVRAQISTDYGRVEVKIKSAKTP